MFEWVVNAPVVINQVGSFQIFNGIMILKVAKNAPFHTLIRLALTTKITTPRF